MFCFRVRVFGLLLAVGVICHGGLVYAQTAVPTNAASQFLGAAKERPNQPEPTLLAGMRPELVWKRTSPNRAALDGPVLYQILFRSSATPGHLPKIAPNFTLTDSLISEGNGFVAIGALSINSSGIVTFANGQTFPGGNGTVSSISAGTGLTGGTITTTGTIGLDTAFTDNRYLRLNGGAMAGMITFANGQTFPGTGTITGIATGAGLTGGGTSGNVFLNIAPGGVTNPMLAANSVSNANIADGTINPAKITGTAAILGANIFTGNQSVNGTVSIFGPTAVTVAQGSTALAGYTSDTSGGQAGLKGQASATTGSFGIGVIGVSLADSGTAIEALETNTTGQTQALSAQARSPNGTAGLFQNTAGGKILSGQNGGGEVFSVDGSGNQNLKGMLSAARVGIGTLTPAFKLQAVDSDATGSGIQINASNTSIATNSFSVFSASANNGAVVSQMYADGLGTGPLGTPGGVFGTYTPHPIGFFTGNIQRMGIGTNGSVSINNKITSYNGVPTAGNGVPGIVAAFNLTGLNTAQNLTLFTPSAPGLFRVSIYELCTTADNSAILVSTFNWRDLSSTDQSIALGVSSGIGTTPILSCNAAGHYSAGTFVVQNVANVRISLLVGLLNSFTSGGNYAVFATVEQLF